MRARMAEISDGHPMAELFRNIGRRQTAEQRSEQIPVTLFYIIAIILQTPWDFNKTKRTGICREYSILAQLEFWSEFGPARGLHVQARIHGRLGRVDLILRHCGDAQEMVTRTSRRKDWSRHAIGRTRPFVDEAPGLVTLMSRYRHVGFLTGPDKPT